MKKTISKEAIWANVIAFIVFPLIVLPLLFVGLPLVLEKFFP